MADPKDLESVRALFAARKDEILSRYGAVGAGIGKNEDEYVITVYLRTSGHQPAEAVRIEGIQVRFLVTGDFRPRAGSAE